jgi:predicted secreted protein
MRKTNYGERRKALAEGSQWSTEECPMNRVSYIIIAAAFLSIVAASASICDNAPCEEAINATLGENFTISLPSNAGTGFEWWIQFDPAFLSLVDLSEVAGDSDSRMMGAPEEMAFVLGSKMQGSTDVIMLLLRPWENGTIEERKIFPVNIT